MQSELLLDVPSAEIERSHVLAAAIRIPKATTNETPVASTTNKTTRLVGYSAATPVPFKRFRARYECMGWRATGGCSPDGIRDPNEDADCATAIHGGRSGFCLYRHKKTNEAVRVLTMHCDSLASHVTFDCGFAASLVDYSARAPLYSHHPPISFEHIQQQVRTQTNKTIVLKQGISIVVHGKVLASAYTSIRRLRELGTAMPVEVWYKPDELTASHALLQDLVDNYGVFLREIEDSFATDFYTKLYAVFYSAFDTVLLLDADNFAARDPTYLFDTGEFAATGAMFWPDFWHPTSTIFNVREQSVLWQVMGLPFADMFEQESGQVLVDRRRHLKALNMLMYFGFTLPRVHEQLVWGDKDLFRLAWLKTNSTFHMIATPPGSAGTVKISTNEFCGMAMVQHDPKGEILFLHRNSVKLGLDKLNQQIWTHVLQVKPGMPRERYVIQWSKIFTDVESCWGRTESADKYTDFTLTPMGSFEFGAVESRLLQLMDEAASVVYRGKERDMNSSPRLRSGSVV